ncbi:hypothetical protein ScPMuIL_000526 [Solemya velum]
MFRSLFKSRQVFQISRCRWLNESATNDDLTEGEKTIHTVLKSKFPNASFIKVHDISGGCGAMYEVTLESTDFQGLRTVLQHKMVTDVSTPSLFLFND